MPFPVLKADRYLPMSPGMHSCLKTDNLKIVAYGRVDLGLAIEDMRRNGWEVFARSTILRKSWREIPALNRISTLLGRSDSYNSTEIIYRRAEATALSTPA